MTKREALSLLDLKPRTELVVISEDQSLRVRGISSEDIQALFERFPPIQGLSVGRGIKLEHLKEIGPKAVAALCAAAVGEMGNEKAEAIAADLPIETQLDILEAMWRCTFSKGFGPFAKRLAFAVGALSVEVGKAPATNLPKASKPSEEQPTPPSGS